VPADRGHSGSFAIGAIFGATATICIVIGFNLLVANPTLANVLDRWQTLISGLLALAGAGLTIVWINRQIEQFRNREQWDVGKELGAFRAETIDLLRKAMLVGNGTWRQVSLPHFSEAHQNWLNQLHARAPTMGTRTYQDLLELSKVMDDAREEFVGAPLGGLAAQELLHSEDFSPNGASHKTWELLSAFYDRIVADRSFMSR
jgi:hypothetical protein